MVKNLQKKNSSLQKRIFLVEDHPVFREGLVRLIDAEEGLTVCGEAGSAEKALKAVKTSKADLVVVDLELPGKNGIELIKEIRGAGLPVKLLVVSMYDEALYADRVLRAGGDGYIMKQENPEDIIHAIHDVLDGHVYVSEDVFEAIEKPASRSVAEPEARSLDSLTDIELNILELLGRGKNTGEIARQLNLPAKKISADAAGMLKKLKLKTSNALIRYAVCWVETGTV